MRRFRNSWAFLLLLACVFPVAAREKLTLRINDAVAVPGATAAIVLRTYASRPIEQGQLCLDATPTDPAQSGAADAPATTQVFSANSDTSSTISTDLLSSTQTFLVTFSSPTATINSVDGPLAVIFVELADDLVPGQTFNLAIDLANTHLTDEFGNPIEIRPRSGTLSIRAPAYPVTFGIEAEDVAPGETARVSLTTNESLTLAQGHIGILYDASIAAGLPQAEIDPRYGNAQYTLDTSLPGIAIVDFVSSDGSFNRIPGNVISLLIPTSSAITPGTQSPILLDAEANAVATSGTTLDLRLESDLLAFTGLGFPGAGEVSDLSLSRAGSGMLSLDWSKGCKNPDGYSIYRGDMASGYASAVPEPGACDTASSSASMPALPGLNEFFIVVPHRNGLSGGYGGRTPLPGACFPAGTVGTTCDAEN